MKKTVTRWAIVQGASLYTGQWLRRVDAIREHIAAIQGPWPGPYRFGALSPHEVKGWRACTARGDRCVKVAITFDVIP